jgi:hypothetical protein
MAKVLKFAKPVSRKSVRRGIIKYKSYMFKDKDPVIDELRTLVADANGGKLNRAALQAVPDNGGPTVSCLKAWFYGKVKRPQNPTVEATGRALGYKRQWVKM